MNNEAVYRTAPATPGLLKKQTKKTAEFHNINKSLKSLTFNINIISEIRDI